MASKPQTQTDDDDKDTHFGFQKVKESEKPIKVYDIFDQIAPNYDRMTDMMTVGTHRFWKYTLMRRLSPTTNTKLIDMASGTGDIAFRFLDYIKNNNVEENCHVTVCDINASMLELAKARSKALNHDPELISFKQADAENLDFQNDSFNAYIVGFGFRYCTHIDKALTEAYRVLEPGGRFFCLEFSHVENPIAQWFYDLYSFNIVPLLGPYFIGGQRDTYQYFVESVRQFPKQETLKTMIEEAGFRNVTYENLFLGIVAIHSGIKPLPYFYNQGPVPANDVIPFNSILQECL